jgi:hypothetical protein
MKECKDCELAVFCYSDPDSWMFRTKKEMREAAEKMAACEKYRSLRHQAEASNSSQRPAKAAGA